MGLFEWKGASFVIVAALLTVHIGKSVSGEDIHEASAHALVAGTEGHILGEVVSEAAIFWGVPYSQPPTGEWRWRAPRDPTSYEGKYWQATSARSGCPQICDKSLKTYICAPHTSEDCLYLNIWVPRQILEETNETSVLQYKHFKVNDKFTKNNSESLAVMFYIHGGNFIMGSGSAVLYDGRFIASRGNVIVVTTNYRLGAIGFLAQDGMEKNNFGVLDQIQALKWVQANAPAFGGNTNKITVVGQSAGAESVGILMTSPYGKGLFQRAILQSNPWSLPYRTLPEAKKFGDKLAEVLGCQPGNMTCLRSISVDKIVNAQNNFEAFGLKLQGKVLSAFQMWSPIIDNDLLLRLPISSFEQEKFHNMPVIIGNDKDDGYLFVAAAFGHPMAKLIYDVILKFIGRSIGSSVLQEYPGCTFCDNREQLSKVATDYVFVCPSRRVLFQIGNNAWSYLFRAVMPWKAIYANYNCRHEVCHGSELPYVFDSVLLTNLSFDALEQNLSTEVQRYWTNFVKYGNPNGDGTADGSTLKHWDRFSSGDSQSYKVLELRDQGNGIVRNFSQATCDFWDHLNAYGNY